MKYKVGDKVRVRKDISVKGNWGFAEGMEPFVGKVVTISRLVDTHDDKYDECMILEDGGEYVWTEEMFEGLVNDAPSITKRINEKHSILNGLTKTDTLKPDYYKYRGGDVFDMAKHFELDYPLGSALKYLLRAGHKDSAKKVEDLNKCIECIKRHLELEE